MKMIYKKARIQEIIQEEYAAHARKKKLNESNRFNDDVPPGDRIKDELQTVMLNAASDFLISKGIQGKEVADFKFELESRLVDAMMELQLPVINNHPSINEAEFNEEELSEAIAEALKEAGLGDGTVMGGNYSVGYGGSQGESPDQPIVPGGKK
ncbi:MAG TPA: hypothetical protein VMW36_04500 [Patescibacteria group bacterium]|nr:hypothetical protein [Patescibacteria group bacterium]